MLTSLIPLVLSLLLPIRIRSTASSASEQTSQSVSHFLSTPKYWLSSLGLVNSLLIGGLGIFAYTRREEIRRADRRVLGAIAVGAVGIFGGQRWVLWSFRRGELTIHVLFISQFDLLLIRSLSPLFLIVSIPTASSQLMQPASKPLPTRNPRNRWNVIFTLVARNRRTPTGFYFFLTSFYRFTSIHLFKVFLRPDSITCPPVTPIPFPDLSSPLSLVFKFMGSVDTRNPPLWLIHRYTKDRITRQTQQMKYPPLDPQYKPSCSLDWESPSQIHGRRLSFIRL